MHPIMSTVFDMIMFSRMLGCEVSMTRKCHNHRLQTNKWFLDEETQNTDSHSTIIVQQLSKMIYNLERTSRTTPQHVDQYYLNSWFKNTCSLFKLVCTW